MKCLSLRFATVWAAPLLLMGGVAGCASKDDRAAAAAALAETAFQQGDLQGARQNIQKAIDARDDVSDYWLTLARIQLAAKNFGGAFDAYENVYQLDRGNIEALRQLCQLGLNVRQADKVDRYADQLLVINPGDPMPITMKGGAALQRGDSKTALAFADKVLVGNPRDVSALILKGQTLAYRGENPAAAKLIEESLDQQSDPTSRLVFLRDLYLKSGDSAGYQRTLARLAERNAGDTRMQLDYADWLYQTDRADQAFGIVRQVLDKNPKNIALASTILEMWLDEGRDAVTRDQIVRGSTGASLETKALFAQFANETGQPDLALQVLGSDEPGAAPDPANSNAKAAYAFALGLKGRMLDALSRTELILDVDSAQPRALLTRARLRAATRNFEGALSDGRQLVTDDPANITARLALTDILVAQNQPELAESNMREALRIVPDSPRAATRLAQMLIAKGQKDEAATVLRDMAKAAKISPRAQAVLATFHLRDNTVTD
ncbi:tetratricopeptide repeat protein [Sphingomonas sp. PAMC 26621]|uniref:tetratricopeptide repeat protein n=1 Tax=Sphingomonas sp. PAMC 26621 TaxID=1112213 RepID=UPI000288AD89|nr:tetratricopeptide repeat protein [Sphingomonas sp. PAMC 26621]